MHRAVLAAISADLSLPQQMAKILVEDAGSEEGVVAILQRAGFTGPELLLHLDQATRLADEAIGKRLSASPEVIRLNRALAGMVQHMTEVS